MALEHDSDLDATAEAVIRQETRHLMVDIRNHLYKIAQQVVGRRVELENIFGETDAETLVEMYEKLQEVVDLVNGDPPPDLPEE